MIDHQAVFNRVIAHLLKQGKRAYVTPEQAKELKIFSGCKYRAPDGSMCAIGCLIADEDYNSKWDEVNATIFKNPEILITAGLKDNPRFAVSLQLMHDEADDEDVDWETNLYERSSLLRQAYNLEWPDAQA